jgi:hypothetical protein
MFTTHGLKILGWRPDDGFPFAHHSKTEIFPQKNRAGRRLDESFSNR